ncbi:MAG: chemoreceptor glutamine deamidase CheD [gamma proteobacterium symbiont of Taylorina sp.]|nr:chemoreceptor glutamine deamidase CheD [gamma proteobacterium symbiont of Taylorina sp.]
MKPNSVFSHKNKIPPKSFSGFESINRYWDNYHNSFAAKILPGEYYVTMKDEMVVTVLGSCVSACIRDRIFGIGGMNHFMLPHTRDDLSHHLGSGPSTTASRYGSYAMEMMINDILKHGGRKENLEVKIFGGGKILKNMSDVGLRNIQFVEEYIALEAIPLISEDTGDIYPRKVVYHPNTGKVKVKKLRSLHNETLIRREEEYQHSIDDKPVNSDIELF